MKTFTATHLNKHAQEVFAAAKEDGSVLIEHHRYEGRFVIEHVKAFVFGEVDASARGYESMDKRIREYSIDEAVDAGVAFGFVLNEDGSKVFDPEDKE